MNQQALGQLKNTNLGGCFIPPRFEWPDPTILFELFRELIDDACAEHVGHLQNLGMDRIIGGNIRSIVASQMG